MKDKQKSIRLILWKYRQQQPLSRKEEKRLYTWVEQSELHQRLLTELNDEAYWQTEIALLDPSENDPTSKIIERRLQDIAYFEAAPKTKYLPRIAIAAVSCIAIFLIFWYNQTPEQKAPPPNPGFLSTLQSDQEVLPGNEKAVLELEDGTRLQIDKTDRNMLAMERYGIFISVENSTLVYRTDMSVKEETHTLYTPRAAQYKVILPDGTAVWLNAASSLRYPTSFEGSDREVSLNGEAYFEVAKMPSKKFIVKTSRAAINVVGTHFNVNAYADEGTVTTTLVEGSVIVETEKELLKLSPGQEAIIDSSEHGRISNTDVSLATAWKEHLFRFQNTPIPQIMKEIERWYNVKVVFRGNITERFTGVLPRDLALGQLLAVLDKSGKFSFEVRDNTVMVIP